jgi:hypothetical protein
MPEQRSVSSRASCAQPSVTTWGRSSAGSDLLFVGLALYTAWRVPMARTPERPPACESRDIGEEQRR